MTDYILEAKKKQQENLRIIYSDLEFNIIPANGKKACTVWKPFQTTRVTIAQLDLWFKGNMICGKRGPYILQDRNHLNFCMMTGWKPWSNIPGLVTVDCDNDEAIAWANSRCPITPLTQITPGGGKHFFYRRPDKSIVDYVAPRGGTWQKGHQFKIDIRADGSYVMAPGSINFEKNKNYEWNQPFTKELIQQCPTYNPLWLPSDKQPTNSTSKKTKIVDGDHEELIREFDLPYPIRIAKAKHYLSKCPGSKQGKGADNYLFALSLCVLWGYAVSADDAIDLLEEWGNKKSNRNQRGDYYPWQRRQIEHKVMNALHSSYSGELGDRFSPRYVEQQILAKYELDVEKFYANSKGIYE